MDFFFRPRGVALIGATPNRSRGGNIILRNALRGSLCPVYPVNPRYTEIEGLTCYPSVSEVPDPVDLAVIFVPAPSTPDLVRQCADRGLSGVIIESGGFAETGAEGQRLQEELERLARERSIRIWGPNCMGLVDVPAGRILSFVSPSIWDVLLSGPVSLVVQSGMLSAGFLIDTMTHARSGISKVCSIGNRADVDECDILEYLASDPETGAVGLYLESVPGGRRFFRILRGCDKPVVVLKAGKSERGARAALSHTASLAGSRELVSGGLAQAGAIEASDFQEMIDLCRCLAAYPRLDPALRGRIGVITYSGAAGIVSADFMENTGLGLADLGPQARERLESVFPEWMPVANPVDLYPAIERQGPDRAVQTALAAVLDDPGVDGVLLHLYSGHPALTPELEPLAGIARRSGKPVVSWLLGSREPAHLYRRSALDLGLPAVCGLDRSVACMRAVFEHHRLWAQAGAPEPEREPLRLPQPQLGLIERGCGALDEHEAKRILSCAGIPCAAERIASNEEEALQAARELGYPVALKGLAPGVVHKTEAGLVRLDLGGDRALREACRSMTGSMAEGGRLLVQRQISDTAAFIAGAVRDPQLGPCVMLGLGGYWAELLPGRVFALAPLSGSDATLLISRFPHQRLLDGYRGSPPVDRDLMGRVLQTLGDLILGFPRIREIDLNPLLAPGGVPTVADASIVLDNGDAHCAAEDPS
jgi:acetyltransferase